MCEWHVLCFPITPLVGRREMDIRDKSRRRNRNRRVRERGAKRNRTIGSKSNDQTKKRQTWSCQAQSEIVWNPWNTLVAWLPPLASLHRSPFGSHLPSLISWNLSKRETGRYAHDCRTSEHFQDGQETRVNVGGAFDSDILRNKIRCRHSIELFTDFTTVSVLVLGGLGHCLSWTSWQTRLAETAAEMLRSR